MLEMKSFISYLQPLWYVLRWWLHWWVRSHLLIKPCSVQHRRYENYQNWTEPWNISFSAYCAWLLLRVFWGKISRISSLNVVFNHKVGVNPCYLLHQTFCNQSMGVWIRECYFGRCCQQSQGIDTVTERWRGRDWFRWLHVCLIQTGHRQATQILIFQDTDNETEKVSLMHCFLFQGPSQQSEIYVWRTSKKRSIGRSTEASPV